MARVKFTTGRVTGFQCEAGKSQSFLWDSAAPGLGLRAMPSGAKSYIFQAKLKSKSIRIPIGDPATVPLEDVYEIDGSIREAGARQQARRLKVMIDGGRDPRVVAQETLDSEQAARDAIETQKEASRAKAVRESVTLGQAWSVYIEARKSKWSPLHLRDNVRVASRGGEQRKRSDKKTAPGLLADLLDLPLTALSASTIEAWVNKEKESRETSAALSYRLLRAFLRWADDQEEFKGLVPSGAASSQRVRESVPKPKTKGDDCLKRQDLPLWFAGVRKIDSPVISAYLQGLLITGARRDALASIKWTDVDFREGSIRVKDKEASKKQKEVVYTKIPLTPYFASLLRELQRLNDTPPTVRYLNTLKGQGKEWGPSPWVFFSKTAKTGRIQEPRPAHVQMLADAGLPHISIHGLRRSFATLTEWIDVPPGISAEIQLHAPQGVREKSYIRRPIDLLRMWHCKIEAWLLNEAGIKQPTNEPGKLKLIGTK